MTLAQPQSQSHFVPRPDEEFVAKSLGQSVRLKPWQNPMDQKRFGEANCFSTALRGGGFVPFFGLWTTGQVSDLLLRCFRALPSGQATRGDLLSIIDIRQEELLHLALFVSPIELFEKASPDQESTFQIRSFEQLMQRYQDSGRDVSITAWRYEASLSCPLAKLNQELRAGNLGELSQRIDQLIYTNSWDQEFHLELTAELRAELMGTPNLWHLIQRLPGLQILKD